MNLLEIVSIFVFFMTVAVEAIGTLRSLKSIIFPIWIVISLLSNFIWITRAKPMSLINLPMVIVILVNLFFIATCTEILWIWSFEIVFPQADALCKSIKFIETTTALMSSSLFIYILILFRHPQTFENEIMKNILLIFVISPILTLPQVRFELFICFFHNCIILHNMYKNILGTFTFCIFKFIRFKYKIITVTLHR